MPIRALALALALLCIPAALPALAPVAPGAPALLPPDAGDHDPAIPRPETALGWPVGEWHARHDQLVGYLHGLAAASERVTVETTGESWEARPLLLLTISSPSNLERIEEIRSRHLTLTDPALPGPDTAGMPAVAYLAYSVHGDEASGANAAMVVAWHLASSTDPEVAALLDEVVVLLDPSLNPDGMARFAGWANMHRGMVPVADPVHREHVEGWPSGRTNHYWFDLNRDWLPAVHPESRARLELFHRWRPNLLIDVHEMGSNSTYFFQPGVPSRQNPLTPPRTLELTREIAAWPAAALDDLGSLYYSEETFDDFYFGKGSTYPDIQGTIGILFEQASARGHVQETVHGELTFPFAIRNQVATSLAALRAARAKRPELLAWPREFSTGALRQAADDPVAGWVFGDPHDRVRGHRLLELLGRHRVRVHALGREIEAGGRRFRPGEAWVVPVDQPQYLLARALFERRTEFSDSTFYDVSTWTLPLAYGLPHAALERGVLEPGHLGGVVGSPPPPEGRMVALAEGEAPVGWVFTWDGHLAPRALFRLLDAGVEARVATQPLRVDTAEGELELGYGTILVPRAIQAVPERDLEELLATVAREEAVDVWAVASGLTPGGIDLGSPSFDVVERPRPLLVVGRGVSAYEAGEVWHHLDARLGIPLPMVELWRLGEVDLEEYSHLILVDGDYAAVGEELVEAIGDWVRAGGVLVATKGAAAWVDEKLRGAETPPPPAPEKGRLPYAEHRRNRDAQLVSGAIFEVALDITHPLAYGYRDDRLAVFRDHRHLLAPDDNPYIAVAQYTDEPLLSGFVSSENLERMRGTPAVLADVLGEGVTVRIIDDPLFRGFWHGTAKLFANALFFGGVIEPTWEARERGGW